MTYRWVPDHRSRAIRPSAPTAPAPSCAHLALARPHMPLYPVPSPPLAYAARPTLSTTVGPYLAMLVLTLGVTAGSFRVAHPFTAVAGGTAPPLAAASVARHFAVLETPAAVARPTAVPSAVWCRLIIRPPPLVAGSVFPPSRP